MSKIRVYVRVRPALPGEFDAPGCFNCTELEDVSGNWIQIKKEGEPKRYFSRVWGPQSQQEEVFRTIGVNTVSDVMEGYYGCIFVYGQTGTGKTFSLGCTTPGLEGIQPRCIQFLFEKIAKEAGKYEVSVKQQYIQLYRDNVQDLLDISKDNLVVRVDNTGATIEGVTTREVRSYNESMDLVREGDGNRAVANTKMNSASSRSHACLITEVYRKEIATGNQTFGRLYLIDLAGSERVSKSGVTGDAYKEAVAINQSLTTLGNCIAGLVAGEKVIAFRDSKLTRILQHSLSGNGRTSIIVTIRPDSPNMQETLCTLKFGERAQKVETQMTPASYRDQFVELSEKVSDHERGSSDGVTSVRINKKWAASLGEVLRVAEAELRDASAQVNAEVEKIQSDSKAEKDTLKAALESEKRRIENQSLAEIESLKSANASVLKEIEDKVADVERQLRDKQAKEVKTLSDTLAKLKAEATQLQTKLDSSNADDGPDFNEIAGQKMASIRDQMNVAKRKLKGCRESAFAQLPLHELIDRTDELKLIRAKLRAKKERLEAKTAGWDKAAMEQAFTKPEEAEISEYCAIVRVSPESEDDDDEAPPSSEPPPTDSDDSSSASESSDSDSSSSDSSASSSSESESETEAEKVELSELQAQGPGGFKKKPKILKESVPRKHFDHALQRDAQLSDLLEQIVEYLEYGCLCYIVNTKTKPYSIHKRHMFLGKRDKDDTKQRSICIAELKEGTNQPDRSTGREVMLLSDVTDLVLGQFSKTFQQALEGAPMVPQGTTMPPTSAKITLNSLAVFFYRSMSLFNHDTPVIDVVFDTDTDFEAWMVTLHRFTLKDPRWDGPLDISTAKDVSRLSEEEKKLCSESHILPSCLLQTKNMVLHKEPRLFYTLFDMRSVSSLDLLHAQKLFEFFLKQGFFERVFSYQIRYADILKAEQEEKERKENQKKLRLRIAFMCKKYVPDSANALGEFLKSVNGQEQAALDQIVKTHGPEPTAAEIAEKKWDVEVAQEIERMEEERRKKKQREEAPAPPPPEEEAPPPPPE